MSSRPELRLDWCSHEAAKYACEKWHYSGKITRNKLVKVGVWEGGDFIGAVVFGTGASDALGKPYGLSSFQVCELVRVALRKHETPVTRIVTIAMKFLKQGCPGVRLIVSFADPAHGHHGGIYQGGNWIYAGRTEPADEFIVNGKVMHGRAVRKTMERYDIAGRNTLERVRKFYDANAEPTKGTSKHRYLMPLDVEMRQRVAPLAKPYPKRAASIAGDAPGHQPGQGGSTPTAALNPSCPPAPPCGI